LSSALQDGIDLLRQGRLAEAGARFAAVAQAEPANALAHHLTGFVQLQTGEREAGLASLRRALALNPDDPAALTHLARGLRESGAPQAALEACERALALNPDFAEARLDRALLLFQLGRKAEALDECDRAVHGDHPLPEHDSSTATAAISRKPGDGAADQKHHSLECYGHGGPRE